MVIERKHFSAESTILTRLMCQTLDLQVGCCHSPQQQKQKVTELWHLQAIWDSHCKVAMEMTYNTGTFAYIFNILHLLPPLFCGISEQLATVAIRQYEYIEECTPNYLAQVRFEEMLETKRDGIKVSEVSKSNESFLSGVWHRRFVCIMSCISWQALIWEISMFISFAHCHGHELRQCLLSISPLRSISWHCAYCPPHWNSIHRRRTSTRSRSLTSFVPVSVSEKESWRQSMTEYDTSAWHALSILSAFAATVSRTLGLCLLFQNGNSMEFCFFDS